MAILSGSGVTFNGNSTLNPGGTAPSYAVRAWINFNGTGTPAARASGNVSSITDNGVGTYTLNFSTALPDANYSAGGYIQRSGNGQAVDAAGVTSYTASALGISCWWANFASGGQYDPATLYVTVVR